MTAQRHRRLVLLGGGHSHIEVLRQAARRRFTGGEILVISPSAHSHYTGMIPGFVRGSYTESALAIDVDCETDRLMSSRMRKRHRLLRMRCISPTDAECRGRLPSGLAVRHRSRSHATAVCRKMHATSGKWIRHYARLAALPCGEPAIASGCETVPGFPRRVCTQFAKGLYSQRI